MGVRYSLGLPLGWRGVPRDSVVDFPVSDSCHPWGPKEQGLSVQHPRTVRAANVAEQPNMPNARVLSLYS